MRPRVRRIPFRPRLCSLMVLIGAIEPTRVTSNPEVAPFGPPRPTALARKLSVSACPVEVGENITAPSPWMRPLGGKTPPNGPPGSVTLLRDCWAGGIPLICRSPPQPPRSKCPGNATSHCHPHVPPQHTPCVRPAPPGFSPLREPPPVSPHASPQAGAR